MDFAEGSGAYLEVRILSIETSGRWGGYAIVEEDEIKEEVTFLSRNLSSIFLSSLESSLRRLNVAVRDLDLIAISTGPGSFTGLRIGLSIGKAFSFAYHIPLVGIPTPYVIRENIPFSPLPVLVLIGCRREEVYIFLYKREDNQWKEIISGEIVKICDLKKKIKEEKVILCGEASLLYREKIKKILEDSVEFLPYSHSLPRPSCLAYLAHGMKESRWEDGLSLSPLYISFPRIGSKNEPL